MWRLRRPRRRLRPSYGRVFVPSALLEDVTAEGRRWAPDETGGMLVGYRTAADVRADLVVTHAIEAGPNAKRARTRFVPDGRWQQEQLEHLYETTDRISTYLGDWHTHPRGGVRPSGVDHKTFERVAATPDARAPHPLILIVSLRRSRQEAAAYTLVADRVRELTLITT
jgi:integrative and conjugative element protein (TIGR02256 family)